MPTEATTPVRVALARLMELERSGTRVLDAVLALANSPLGPTS